MPQSEPTITAELVEWAVKSSNKHFGPLLTTCLMLSAAMGIVGVASCGIHSFRLPGRWPSPSVSWG